MYIHCIYVFIQVAIITPQSIILVLNLLSAGSPDASMSTVLWAKTQQLQEDAFRQLQNIYGGERNIKQARKLQDGQAVKLTSLKVDKLKSRPADKIAIIRISCRT